jgi:hypothetical protein
MTDIVERLRDPSRGSPRWGDTMDEAADEIERLRADVTRCKESLEVWDTYAGDIIDSRDRLRSGFLMAMQYDNKCRQTGQPCDASKLCACFLETEGWCDAPKEARQ